MHLRPTLRLLLAMVALLCLGAAAGAQEQDRKLEERLTRPNMNMTYDTSQSSFGKPSAFQSKGAVSSKEFGGTRSFLSREFLSKPYGGAEKKSWLGNLLSFSSKKADTQGKYEIPNAGTPYGTKAAPTREAYGAQKTAATSAYAQNDLHYLKRNRFDASPNKTVSNDPSNLNKPIGYTGDLRPMTIDDVRELLNKNK